MIRVFAVRCIYLRCVAVHYRSIVLNMPGSDLFFVLPFFCYLFFFPSLLSSLFNEGSKKGAMKFAALLHVVLLASPVRGSAASFSLGCVEMDASLGGDSTYAVSFEDAEEEAKAKDNGKWQAKDKCKVVSQEIRWNDVFSLDSDNTAATNLKVACQSDQEAKDDDFVALVVSDSKGAKSLEKCNTIAAEMNKNLKRRAPDAPLFSGVCKQTKLGTENRKVKHNVLVFNNQTDCEESTKILEYLMKDHFCSVRFGPNETQHCSGHGTCVDRPDLKDYACTCNNATADTPYCDWSDTTATGCSIVGNNCQFTYARTRKGEKSIMAMIDSDRNFYESFNHSDKLVESVMSRYGWVNLTALVDVHVLKDGTPTPVSKGKRITNGAHGMTFTFKANGLKPPGEFLINPTNGYMLAIPGKPVDEKGTAVKSAEYEVQVFGQRTDGSGTLTEFELETLKLNISESVDFTCELKDPNNESREGGHVINRHTNNASSCEMSPEGTCVYTVGESYSFGEIEKTRGEEEFLWDAEACDGRSGPESCRSATKNNAASMGQGDTIWFTLDKSPPGFLLNGMTGEMQGVPKENGTFDLLIYAWYGLDKKSAVPFINTTMEVRYKDTDLPEILDYSDDRLPNCTDDNTDEPYDEVKFDQKYTCKCKDDWGGATCNERTEKYLNSEASKMKAEAAAAARGDNMAYALGGAGGLLGMILIVFVGYKVNAYRIKMKPADFDTLFQAMVASGEIDPEEVAARKNLTPREIKRSHLNLVEVVGHGQFGEVWKGMLDETSEHRSYLVAAKTVLDAKSSPEATLELEQEAIVMAQVGGHPHLVSLIGVITRGDPLVLIISYCEHGSLLSLLRKRASEGSPLYLEAKLKLALDTAQGMAHLHSKHFVHRDLAARNVLVATGMIGQVADFGLSRGTKTGDGEAPGEETEEGSTYYRSQSGIFPVRWTAPEAMESLKFSAASDIWSFAITLVEIMQDGEKPYEKMKTNAEVMTSVMAGTKHEKPLDCSQAMYSLLTDCWAQEPGGRPDFKKCVTVLQAAHKKEKERPKARRRSTAASLAPLSEAPAGDGHVVDKDGYLMPGKTSASAEDAQVVNEYTDFGFGGADEEPAKK